MPGSSKTIYFVTGSDEAAVKSAAAHLAESLMPNTDVWAREVIDGTGENADQAVECIANTIQALLTFPFLQESKLVWLKNASMLADSVTGRSESVTASLEKLQTILETGLPQGIIFLLSAPEADKRRVFYKATSKLANVTICDIPNFGWNSIDANMWLEKKALSHGLNFTNSALELLAIRIEANTRQAESEFTKLTCALLPENINTPITEDLIRELVPNTRESSIFDLSNAIFARDIHHCLSSLQQLFFQGESAISILLVAITPAVRNLIITKDLIEHYHLPSPSHANAFAHSIARLPSENLAHLPKKKDGNINTYAMGIAAMNCSRYSLEELKLALTVCTETNRLLISAPLDENILLTRLIFRIVGKSPSYNH